MLPEEGIPLWTTPSEKKKKRDFWGSAKGEHLVMGKAEHT